MQIIFPGQTVLVTGAVRGIGRGIVHAFATRGAHVHAADIETVELPGIAAGATLGEGGSIETHTLDVTDPAAVEALVARIGTVDIAVHSAGGVRSRPKVSIDQVTDADWRAIQAVNVDGAFHVARAVVPGMKQAGKGRIVIISSRAGLGVSLTGIQSYGTAKAAQIGLVRQLAAELGPFGITVNSVAPGFMPTSPDYIRQWESYGEDGQKALVAGIAMRRVGRPDDIAHAVMFLASDYAEWITGQTLPVCGGP
ncbi:MAG TPA: SDR family NAD(P)-dependent oxidoreductase [Thermohalobaculum sp.]|nr:SDR family NAD(P)-dependent oxidoreductase [Thermohalobaculum sp.]